LDKDLYEYFPEDPEGSAFEIKPTKDEDGKDGAAVYAKVDVPAGSYVMPTHLVASFEVFEDSMENISGDPIKEVVGVGKATVIEDFIDFIDEHSHSFLQAGNEKNFVEIGGYFLMRTSEDESEANVYRWIPNRRL